MTAYLGLGSNLGNKEENLRQAIVEIEKRIGTITDQSDFIETEPWGYTSNNRFVNAVIRIDTPLSPLDLLNRTQQIEIDMGRTEKTVKEYHDRIIDIDILEYENVKMETPELTLPHPKIGEREFVRIPLHQIKVRDRNRYLPTDGI